ncbi:MAG TPA: Rne/Rng family ribonuclease [Candidatus Omnitrophota bacterium]|nr:Rne/Rng family ribonuclease [Candidatus Omnitrophota bacterium]
MGKEILISKGKTDTRVAIIDRNVLEDFYIEVDQHQSMLGNVYKGRVESILPSINGAFVNIGHERNGFLYLTDADNPLIAEEMEAPRGLIQKILKGNENKKRPARGKGELPLKEGQEILVQVVKDPFAQKGPRLTTHISLAGRFVVYMPFDPHNGISKKIASQEERDRLKEVLDELNFSKNSGVIIRTASLGQTKRELVRDARFLHKVWQEILKLAEKKQAPALVYKDYDLVSKVVRDYLKDDVDKVVIDSLEDYKSIRKFTMNLVGPLEAAKIHCYRGQKTLFEHKGVSKQLSQIYDTRVYIRGGAHIVIEPTEGLTVVDVNSGKFKMKGTPEEAAFVVNMAAAPEIARQLRLRDVGGIIVIDFIDMTREAHKRKVLDALKFELSKDHAKTEVNRISPLGLVEMTRARTGKTLEAVSFKTCPYCHGRGKVRL